MDDQVLAKRAQRGDPVAFEVLVRRHTDTVWRFARAMVHDDHVAEEIVQDTFVKAYRGLRTYRGEGALTTWLYTICRRTALDHRRKGTVELLPLDAVTERAAPEPVVQRDDLVAALGTLPVDEREVFVLCAVLGYSQEEAAALAGVPASTMRSRMVRARTRLVACLREEEECS